MGVGLEQAKTVIDYINDLPWPLNWLAWIAVLAGTLGVVVWRNIKFIHLDELGVPLRKGKERRDAQSNVIYKPTGIRGKVPFIDKIIVVNVRDRVFVLEETRVDYPNPFLSLDVKATVILKVAEAFKTAYIVNLLDEAVRGVCEAELWECILEGAPEGHLNQENRPRIAELYAKRVNPQIGEWGLELLSVSITRSARNYAGINSASIASLGSHELALQTLVSPTK